MASGLGARGKARIERDIPPLRTPMSLYKGLYIELEEPGVSHVTGNILSRIIAHIKSGSTIYRGTGFNIAII